MTTPRYRSEIEAHSGNHPLPRFVFVDTLSTRAQYVAYVQWIKSVNSLIEKLHASRPFDLVHHLTYTNMWLPMAGSRLNIPFIAGPLGGGPRVPLRLFPELGLRGTAREATRALVQTTLRYFPPALRSLRRADIVLAANLETFYRLPRSVRVRAQLQPNTTVGDRLVKVVSSLGPERHVREKRALVAGRLLPWKGVSLALRAFTHLPQWQLVVVGQGPDEGRLRRLAEKLDLTERVEFVTWLEQEDLWRRMAESVVIVPSLRDDGPTVLFEAVALGAPTVALEQGLARLLQHDVNVLTTPATGREATARHLAGLIEKARPIGPSKLTLLQENQIQNTLTEVYSPFLSDRL